MASPIVIKIEVPAWMKKYLIFQSENKTEPLEFHRKHNYNRLLINLVTNRTDVIIYKPDLHEEDINNAIVKIKLPFNGYKDVYFYNKIGINNKKKFRAEVKIDFLFQYRTELRNKLCRNIERKTATEEFLDKLKINEDELKYESLYRKYTRYMNKEKLIC